MSTQTATLTAPITPFTQTIPGRITLAVGASLFVAAAAHLSFPIPYTPVPLTLSDLAVLLVGLTLGPTTAFAALCLYLLEGVSGLPVFSAGNYPDLAHRFLVTGGYLISYPFAAALAGFLRRRTTFAPTLLAAAIASAFLMTCGVVWLAVSLHLTPAVAFAKGALPFLPGQAIKVLSAAGIATAATRLRKS